MTSSVFTDGYSWGDLRHASLEAIGRVLVDSGIEAFFGLAGSGNFAVLNALRGGCCVLLLPDMSAARS